MLPVMAGKLQSCRSGRSDPGGYCSRSPATDPEGRRTQCDSWLAANGVGSKSSKKKRANVAMECDYFTARADRVQDEEYLAAGLPIAKGVSQQQLRVTTLPTTGTPQVRLHVSGIRFQKPRSRCRCSLLDDARGLKGNCLQLFSPGNFPEL